MKNTLKFSLGGMAFGLCFLLIAVILDLRGSGPILDRIIELYRTQPLHWIIGLAPLLLGLMAYLVGRCYEQALFAGADLERQVAVRTSELEAANEKLSKITSSARDAIIMMDPEGRISFWNPAAERIFGYSNEEIIGKPLHHTLAPERHLAAFHRGFVRFRESGEGAAVDRTLELTALRKDGSEFPIELSLSAVQIRGQWHAIGILRDITARKKAEEELVSARKRAEEADQAKSKFLANMSHEIRTPMNAVIGFSDLLLKTRLDPTQRDYARTIRNSAHALLELIDDILDFSKIEAGRMELEKRPFRLRDLLAETADLFREKVAETGIELIVDVEKSVPDGLLGDPLRLRQVLVNLTGNAIKFTEEGEVVIRVEPREVSDDQAILFFSVQDTGIGIAPEKAGKLFSPFTQADESTTRKYGGTGLGLAVCKQLVELMEGQIQVESEPGRGSTFYFTATFGRSELAEKEPPALLKEMRNLHVLLIDDNASNREVMQKMLESFGWRAESAASGEEGLAKLRKEARGEDPFDLALIDWRMPGMDGLEVCARIAEDPSISKVRIIVMTAFGRGAEREHAEELGVDAFLIKPIRPSLLFDTLAGIFGRELPEKGKERVSESNGGRPFEGKRVLLVEDNSVNQKLARILLEKAGFSVDLAENGRDAVEAVRARQYDAVLMDVQMPEMDGYEATREIRRDPNQKDLPIIAMTASAMQGDEEKCLEAGMNDYVAKPIDPMRLFEILKKWIETDSKGGSLTATSSDHTEGEKIEARKLPGIDQAGLLKRVGGSEEVMKELLAEFGRSFEGTAEKLRAFLDRGETPEALRLAHTLKGAAGNLSADRLHEAAQRLERTLREKSADEVPDEQIAEVASALAEVLEGIGKFEGRETVAETVEKKGNNGRVSDPESLVPLFARLNQSIEECDPVEVETRAMELESRIAGTEASAGMQELAEQARSFDFDAARETLSRIARDLSIPLEK